MFQTINQTEQGKEKHSNSSKSNKNKEQTDLGDLLKGHEMVGKMNSRSAQMKEAEDDELIQGKLIQKAAADEEEKEVMPKLAQRKATANTGDTSVSNSSGSMPEGVQHKMENSFATSFADVKIHKNDSSATQMGALAYTQGNNIHFAPNEYNPASSAGQELLGHELTHVVQQRQGRVQPTKQGKGLSINDNPSLESEADVMGKKAASGIAVGSHSSKSLGIRNSLRTPSVQAKSGVIQRNIKSSKALTNGKMELDLTKVDATASGGKASEEGWVRFHPNSTAPDSNSIRLVQIVRTIDVGGATSNAGDPVDWTKVGNGGEGNRNNVMTTADSSNNVAGNFFVDHSAGASTPRTNKGDAAVLPYYNAHWDGATGSKAGTSKVAATLWDAPGTSIPLKFNFVTSAKGDDTGFWYGTALWGFEIYSDGGIAKVKNEYSSFRDNQGATTDAALEKFNEFYKNPGSTNAPK